MLILDTIFGFYDRYVLVFSPNIQVLIAFLLIFLLTVTFVAILKKGHWIFIVLFALLFPGGWSALRIIGSFLLLIARFLLTRIQFNL